MKAPVLDDIDPTYHLVKFNGSLTWPSIYRGQPSQKVDEAWNRLEMGK